MTVRFVSLYQTSQSVVDSNGNCSITFSLPRLDRVWLGTLAITGSTAGTSWQVYVGSQSMGILLAPGPGGPFQVLGGLALTAQATGLTPGDNILAALIGTDFSKEYAPPYTGPTSVTSVNSGGP